MYNIRVKYKKCTLPVIFIINSFVQMVCMIWNLWKWNYLLCIYFSNSKLWLCKFLLTKDPSYYVMYPLSSLYYYVMYTLSSIMWCTHCHHFMSISPSSFISVIFSYFSLSFSHKPLDQLRLHHGWYIGIHTTALDIA